MIGKSVDYVFGNQTLSGIIVDKVRIIETIGVKDRITYQSVDYYLIADYIEGDDKSDLKTIAPNKIKSIYWS